MTFYGRTEAKRKVLFYLAAWTNEEVAKSKRRYASGRLPMLHQRMCGFVGSDSTNSVTAPCLKDRKVTCATIVRVHTHTSRVEGGGGLVTRI